MARRLGCSHQEHANRGRGAPSCFEQQFQPRTREERLPCDQDPNGKARQGGERIVRTHRQVELELFAQRSDQRPERLQVMIDNDDIRVSSAHCLPPELDHAPDPRHTRERTHASQHPAQLLEAMYTDAQRDVRRPSRALVTVDILSMLIFSSTARHSHRAPGRADRAHRRRYRPERADPASRPRLPG